MLQFYKEKLKDNKYVTIVRTNEDGVFYRYMFSNSKHFAWSDQFIDTFERVEDENKNFYLNKLESGGSYVDFN